MENETPDNTEKTRIYVRFGAHPTDEMPQDWAEKMLTLWRTRQPAQFGKLLSEVVLGDR